MINEVRNELLMILQIEKEPNSEDRSLRVRWLIERFEEDLKTQLKDLESKEKEIKNNLEVVDYVRKELNIK